MANKITALRIICSIALLFVPLLSTAFYILYLLAGLSDMLDGAIARKTGTVSEFGSKLDSMADFVFVVVCLVKLLPVLHLSGWQYAWIALIAAIKVVNVIFGYATQKKFVDVHSVMNKVTGGVLFLLPLTLSVVDTDFTVSIACFIATFAAVQENCFIKEGDKKLCRKI